MTVLNWAPTPSVTADSIRLDDLEISFHRTIRGPDNDQSHALPLSLGHFPLFKVADYVGKLPAGIAQKGGLLFPMYQREAMWISFSSRLKYAIKIYFGGVNAISGEPAVETPATMLRRRTAIKDSKSIQDYIYTPQQRWLNGFTVEPGQETTGGLQIEITRIEIEKPREPKQATGPFKIYVRAFTGKILKLMVDSGYTIANLKDLIQDQEGIPADQQRIICAGRILDDLWTLSDYYIREEYNLYLVHRRGGGSKFERAFVADGPIKQTIAILQRLPFVKSNTATFNVQILNSAMFQQVTGRAPPTSPISAETYARYGSPFFAIYEEPPLVAGDFAGVKSVAQIEQPDKNVKVAVIDLDSLAPAQPWACTCCGASITTLKGPCRRCQTDRTTWTCIKCNYVNLVSRENCEMCSAGGDEDEWNCPQCTFANAPGSKRCVACHGNLPNKVMDSTDGKSREPGFFNPGGPYTPFRFEWEIASQLKD